MTGSHGFAKGGSGLLVLVARPHPVFDLVEVLEEVDNAGGMSFSGIKGFDKVTPYVGKAAAEVDAFDMIFRVSGVDSVAIDLEVAGPGAEVVSEGLFKVIATAAILPLVAHAASGTRVIKRPNVAGVGFAGSGSEFFDGAFVNLEIGLIEAILVDRFGNRPQEFEALQRPVVQGVARNVQSETLQDALLSIKRTVGRRIWR